MEKEQTLLEIFRDNKGYARTGDVLAAGFHNHYLDVLAEEGKVVKIKRGLYRLASVSVDDELEEVSRIIPDGVVCLFSAWNYYGLSDFVPPEYHIAIEKSRKVVLPDYPPIKVYYWSEKYWSLGITQITVGNTEVPIYEREKSVCDAIRFRNKIGKDVEKEVLKNYLKEPDRNIDQLLHYARLLRVERQMKNYLGILL
jgi:predicted transcriptional regulator of viral defense system